jgi:hypothetical protein
LEEWLRLSAHQGSPFEGLQPIPLSLFFQEAGTHFWSSLKCL